MKEIRIALFAIAAIGTFSFPFLLLTILVLIGSNIALARPPWKPSARLLSAIGDAGEELEADVAAAAALLALGAGG